MSKLLYDKTFIILVLVVEMIETIK